MVYIYGEEGLGKSLIGKMAASYAFERRVFPDGVIYIDLNDRTDPDIIFHRIAREIDIPGVTAKQLCVSIAEMYLLIILDNVTCLIDRKPEKFRQKLSQIYENTVFPKFIILAEQPGIPGFSLPMLVQINKLNNEQTIRLLKSLVNKAKHK
jgi:hypothetical protein